MAQLKGGKVNAVSGAWGGQVPGRAVSGLGGRVAPGSSVGCCRLPVGSLVGGATRGHGPGTGNGQSLYG